MQQLRRRMEKKYKTNRGDGASRGQVMVEVQGLCADAAPCLVFLTLPETNGSHFITWIVIDPFNCVDKLSTLLVDLLFGPLELLRSRIMTDSLHCPFSEDASSASTVLSVLWTSGQQVPHPNLELRHLLPLYNDNDRVRVQTDGIQIFKGRHGHGEQPISIYYLLPVLVDGQDTKV
ncbi:hypothetical protein CALCODRAFT_8110 [Calocera cornea HHB12733]|uniref:Uncharacterized protein n=1 Tax=Calocera cornea HHB12733 TaxID=1353952 RepID=A0A165KD62_9BASI|nr:hypothetical protein CALCODRAFT_8110 [Calocera cornea HHB12733]